MNFLILSSIILIIYLLIVKNSSSNSFIHYIITKLCQFRIIPPYNQIIDNLWLGNFISSLDEKFLVDNNIKLIINLSKNLKFITRSENLKNITFYRIPIQDNLSQESDEGLIKSFNNAYRLIDKHLSNKQGVLIHCKAGMQRSATLVALYLMKKRNINFNQAKKLIVSKRFIAFKPYIHFNKVITHFDK